MYVFKLKSTVSITAPVCEKIILTAWITIYCAYSNYLKMDCKSSSYIYTYMYMISINFV